VIFNLLKSPKESPAISLKYRLQSLAIPRLSSTEYLDLRQAEEKKNFTRASTAD